MCSLASLTSAQRDELLALVVNIERVMKIDAATSAADTTLSTTTTTALTTTPSAGADDDERDTSDNKTSLVAALEGVLTGAQVNNAKCD